MSHASERELQPGQVIADRYRLEAPIGRGAMGAVWRAVHVRLESPVAIKFLNASIAGDRDMLERFLREARSAAAVRSSHVVQIFDYGVDGGVAYIAMELLVGEPLDERLEARGALAPPELDKVFGEVARAVGVAHELGVVHRDIKPANIFVAREGGHEVTKVLDFGIAKLIDRALDAPAGSGTHTGIILGTPNYMSPEQARGHRQVDHRADLWSLAVLAFECLTGRQPFESSSVGDLVVQICTAPPLVPSEVASVPAAFDAWFLRGVSKDPEARFRSASEMAEALHVLLAAEGLGAESRPRSGPARLERARPESVQEDGPSRHPRPGELAASLLPRPSQTAKAMASEVLASNTAPAQRRKLAAVALPFFALGIAIVAVVSRPARDGRLEQPPAAAYPSSAPLASPASRAQASGAPAGSGPAGSSSTVTPAERAPAASTAGQLAPSALASVGATSSPPEPRNPRRPQRTALSAQRSRKSVATAPSPPARVTIPEAMAPAAPPSLDPYADRL